MSQHSVKFYEPKRHAIYARDSYTCQYCGHDAAAAMKPHLDKAAAAAKSGDHEAAVKHKTDAKDAEAKHYAGHRLSLDHIDAQSTHGTGHDPTGLITVCHSCNYAKQEKTPREWNAYIKAKGVEAINWTKVRRQAQKPIGMKDGKVRAESARAYRESKGIVSHAARALAEKRAAEASKAAAKQAEAGKAEAGPGVTKTSHPDERARDDHGRFEAEGVA